MVGSGGRSNRTTAARARSFVALDFETADYGPDSACAIGLERVEGSRIVRREHHLIRPPREDFVFTYLHGISWSKVARKPSFRALWPKVRPLLEGVDFVAAHNASFDRGVLNACCRAARLRPPAVRFVCTVALARRTWDIYPTKLPNVCQHLGLRLRHHDALSDAEACARIVLAADAAASGTAR